MAEPTALDRWDELNKEADLLKLAIATEVLRARHIETAGPPAEPWDNAQVSKERRKKWAAVENRSRASRALDRILGRTA